MKFDHSEDLQKEKPADHKEELGVPPLPEKNSAVMADIGVYGMSLQGSSHVDRNQPCQDYSDFRLIPESHILIAAISDGVGSCSLSHWGSYTVVTRTLDVLEKELTEILQGKKITEIEGKIVGNILRKAFVESKDAVEEIADRLQQPVPNFYSTLTAAIYDGSLLYYGHIGDDGIVVQFESGKYQLITTRHKGEEANSVNPLQAGSPNQLWQFGRVTEPVVGFLMSTDGVLDKYVSGMKQNNRVFYPFLENALYSMMDYGVKSKEEIVQDACGDIREKLNQPEYRSVVTDDITVLAAVNMEMLKTAVHPVFSMEAWRGETEQHRQEMQKKLYSSSQGVKMQGQNETLKDPCGKKNSERKNGPAADRGQDREQKTRRDQRQERRQEKQAEKRPKKGPEYIDIIDLGHRDPYYERSRKKGSSTETYEPDNEKGFLEKFLDKTESFLFGEDISFDGPELRYCPRCKRIYEVTWDNPYQYCPRCGIETKHYTRG